MAAAVVTPEAPPVVRSPTAAATGIVSPQTAATNGGFASASLYVGDLEANVNETQLYDLFNELGQVVTVRVCRDQEKRMSLGYGYVNYSNHQDAAKAVELLNFTLLNGKPIRIMFSCRDPSIRKTGLGNVFIKNLDLSIDNKSLHETFSAFGNVLSCKVAVDSAGQSKGFGFVQFDQEEAAQRAIKTLNGMLINDKKVYVGPFVRQQERGQEKGSIKFTNVYVKNISETTTDEDLTQMFGTFGSITSVIVAKDADGKSRCFGFVNFQEPDAAVAAVEKFNGSSTDDGKVLYVGRAQRKAERVAELKSKFEQERNARFEKMKGSNLYLKNLDESISDDEKLKELFSEFGTITSCKVMLDPQGVSKGSGFVSFSSPEEATKALREMHDKMVGRKPLYVAVAQRKDERRALLQAQFVQQRAPGPMTTLPAGITGYYAGARRFTRPLFFGQGYYAGAPGVSSSNFMMPFQQLQMQDQTRNGFSPRRPESTRVRPQQVMYRGRHRGLRNLASWRNVVNQQIALQARMGNNNMVQLPFDVPKMATSSPMDIPISGPMPIDTLTSSTTRKTGISYQKI